MAIRTSVRINITVYGDAASTSYSFDLLTAEYRLQDAGSTNWFTESKKSPNPVDVVLSSGTGVSNATLSGTVITLTFSTPPPVGNTPVEINVLFA